MNIAIIPARGGSKRVPKKNIKLFFGKPLIFYSIDAAKKSGIFEKIYVSTDSKEIAKVAKEFGAEVLFRPKELADDFTGTTEVVSNAVKTLQENGEKISSACCIYATAPFLKPLILQEAFKVFKESKKDYVFSATSFAYPIFRALKKNCEMFFPDFRSSRSQDLEEAYHDAGQFYFGKSKAWVEKRAIFTNSSKMFKLPRYLVHDIDTLEDWEEAEIFYEVLNESSI